MNKRLLPFFVFILFYSSALCQYKTLLSENFSNNKAGWPVQSDSSFLVAVQNGSLHLEKFIKNFDDRGCLWYHKEIKGLNTLQDFSITIYAKFISGGDHSNMFDIQWGHWDTAIAGSATRLYQLDHRLGDYVKLAHFNKGWDYSLWGKAAEILNRNLYRPNVYNKYELVQKDGFIIFNINDQQYFKQFAIPIAGNGIGFQHCLKGAWEIDKIIVKQARNVTTIKSNDTIVPAIPADSAYIAGKAPEELLKVYPNPFVNEFTVLLSITKAAIAKIELTDIKGTLILEYSKKLEVGEHAIRLFADVPAGIYLVKSTVNNKVTTAKLLKL